MSEPFIAEIRIFPYIFAPRGWAYCDGQLVSIAQQTSLYSILGTIYGGDGYSNFALPNLQGRVPLGAGNGPGLTPQHLGDLGGSPTVALTTQQIPTHTHQMVAVEEEVDNADPKDKEFATNKAGRGAWKAYGPAADLTPLASSAISQYGSGQGHENRMPYLTVSYCIAMEGVYPTRS
ncbi:MAG: tail fiber protein [Proteobacteria bacterium]|nr:tail fiber protein [Pseudomonadota bacterium]MBU1685713.1 tail fiber protein [Pseudomonadota bacterium]